MKNLILLFFSALAWGCCETPKHEISLRPSEYVTTLVGTQSDYSLSTGNTYPAVALPWGMNFWTPQTGKMGDGWAYTYGSHTIRGLKQTHQPSPWINDYGQFSIMPVRGKDKVDENARQSWFSHQSETAKPYYYSVYLADHDVVAEMAPTDRAAVLRFTFPESDESGVVIDAFDRGSQVKVMPDSRTVVGYTTRNSGGVPDNFRNWFVIRFDKPFSGFRVFNGKNELKGFEAEGEHALAAVYFTTRRGEQVTARVASSFISGEQALRNLETEVGDADFETVKARAQERWDEVLGRIEVSGGTEEQYRTFYSCLYRSTLFPRKFYEIDAKGNPVHYSPYNGEVLPGYMYTDTGFWDTFRSQFPLTNILHPTMQGRYMQALLAAQEQCGWLPSWSAPGETGGMLGNHSISLLTDAWVKGIRTFDPAKALEAYAHEAMNKGPWGGANGRAGWKEYWQLGYVPYPESMGSTAQTLEYAYDDFCAWQLARMTGNKFYEEIFSRVMYNYRNVFDHESGFMRGRLKDGSWLSPFDPYEWGGPYCEGNAWHYNWSVFHDVQGLINLYGSDETFTQKIDSVFTRPNIVKPGTYGGMIHEMKEMQLAEMGQYAHGNQPIQHMIYMYSYAGQPWKTQYWSRQITSRLYNSSERGYPGDEDQGGMSSWYILSSLGIYSVCPGTDQYVLGSPVFRKATITMEDGRKFTIEAAGNSPENVYIQSATLNGKPLEKNWITYGDIARGGVMRFEMGPEPNKSRCTSKEASPFSLSRPE